MCLKTAIKMKKMRVAALIAFFCGHSLDVVGSMAIFAADLHEMKQRNVVENIESRVASRIGGLRAGVALSGGADSVALLLAAVAAGCDAVALHCNFSLRGDESDSDTEFCRALCRSLGVELREVRFDTMSLRRGGESIEMACRRLRYDWFAKMAAEMSLSGIALAHHKGDQAETMMLNLLRGSGPRGLAGMPAERDLFIRPLLGVDKSEILSYLEAKGVGYRTDSSNLSNDYRRNALRNVVLPRIREYFPDCDKGLDATRRAMSQTVAELDLLADLLADRFASIAVDDAWCIDIEALSELSSPEAALYRLSRHSSIDSPLSLPTVRSVLEADGGEARWFRCENGRCVVVKNRKMTPYVATHEDVDESLAKASWLSAVIVGKAEFAIKAEDQPGRRTVYFDADAIGPLEGLTLRHWRAGDRIKPFGMAGSRKVSDIFSDLHFSPIRKAETMLLCRGDDILWICGIRSSRLYPVGADTRRVLCIKMQP